MSVNSTGNPSPVPNINVNALLAYMNNSSVEGKFCSNVTNFLNQSGPYVPYNNNDNVQEELSLLLQTMPTMFASKSDYGVWIARNIATSTVPSTNLIGGLYYLVMPKLPNPNYDPSPQCFKNACSDGTVGNNVQSEVVSLFNNLMAGSDSPKDINAFLKFLPGSDFTDGYLYALWYFINEYQTDNSSPASLKSIVTHIYCEMYATDSTNCGLYHHPIPCTSSNACSTTDVDGMCQFYGTCIAPTPPACNPGETQCTCTIPSQSPPAGANLDGCCPSGAPCNPGGSALNETACACCLSPMTVSCGGTCMDPVDCNPSQTICCMSTTWPKSANSCPMGPTDQLTC